MANYSSNIIAQMDTKPVTPVGTRANRGRAMGFVGTLTKLAQSDIGGVARLFRVRSDDVLLTLAIFNDAMAGLTAVNVGLYKPGGGVEVDLDLLSPVAFSFATNNGVTAILSPTTSSAMRAAFGQTFWQRLGLPSDPGVQYDVALTFTTDGSAGGVIAFTATILSGS